jgi:hypothetical protein
VETVSDDKEVPDWFSFPFTSLKAVWNRQIATRAAPKAAFFVQVFINVIVEVW